MLRHIRQRLPQCGDQLVGQPLRHASVEQTIHPEPGGDAERIGGFLNDSKHPERSPLSLGVPSLV